MNNFWNSFFKLSIALVTISSFNAYGKEGLLADCGEIKIYGSNDNNVLKITQFQWVINGTTLSASNLKSSAPEEILGNYGIDFGIEVKISQNGQDFARYADGYSALKALGKLNVKEANVRATNSNRRIESIQFYKTPSGNEVILNGYIPNTTRIRPYEIGCQFGDALNNQTQATLDWFRGELEKKEYSSLDAWKNLARINAYYPRSAQMPAQAPSAVTR